MFIKRLEIVSDSTRILSELNNLIQRDECKSCWDKMNQLALKTRAGAESQWEEGTGSLYDRETHLWRGAESDFDIWNIDESWYVRQQIEALQNTLNVKLGRIRFMRLMPNTGLSVHMDKEIRYHLALQTNPKAYIAHSTKDLNLSRSVIPSSATCYNIPRNNTWYEVDTREQHWVYNGGQQERIHLVVCGV